MSPTHSSSALRLWHVGAALERVIVTSCPRLERTHRPNCPCHRPLLAVKYWIRHQDSTWGVGAQRSGGRIGYHETCCVCGSRYGVFPRQTSKIITWFPFPFLNVSSALFLYGLPTTTLLHLPSSSVTSWFFNTAGWAISKDLVLRLRFIFIR